MASSTLLLLSASVFAQNLIIYPAQGQDSATQQADEGACFVWARNQTGIDPMAQNNAPVQQAQTKRGGAVGGALGGAAIGGIFGNSSGAKKGAAAGALMGGVSQSNRNRAAEDQAKQQAANQQQMNAANQQQFNRAYATCLQGRGYSVN
ncbi:MAG: hypothetical protein DRQ60_06445 [Gammaproteobacteria bacterium]|nr:MAG: hypothetical protein DRQ54_05075 [Gammaproteobacteria bacterium]RLA14633.1 MAG: hypothetical protein DRQ60_06445 [Gammaproteobacteria bacterium]RLA14989.1 MAG: hypothetical protein DRQ52_02905 [Gammaproteobacteria bacterium]